jgi:hypothetical protein
VPIARSIRHPQDGATATRRSWAARAAQRHVLESRCRRTRGLPPHRGPSTIQTILRTLWIDRLAFAPDQLFRVVRPLLTDSHCGRGTERGQTAANVSCSPVWPSPPYCDERPPSALCDQAGRSLPMAGPALGSSAAALARCLSHHSDTLNRPGTEPSAGRRSRATRASPACRRCSGCRTCRVPAQPRLRPLCAATLPARNTPIVRDRRSCRRRGGSWRAA